EEKTGKLKLSRRVLLPKPEDWVEPERKPRGDGGNRRRDDRGGNDRRRDDRGGRDSRGGGNRDRDRRNFR
ncbi:MAG TPA: hypothetical protein PLK12_12495, partial [Prolixibacteraceae bacterium]|nr:hypothetical protein [Prolixibacteraceae bacterium]